MTDWIRDAGWLSEVKRLATSGDDEGLHALLQRLATLSAVPEAGERASYLEPSRRDWTAEEQRRADHDSGRWCGECHWGEVDDPPCCYDDFPAPVVGERAFDEMVALTQEMGLYDAPAVPVGVQRGTDGLTDQERQEGAERYEAGAGATPSPESFTAARTALRAAVPVVHPEPGDREAQRAAIEHTYVLAEQLLSEVGWLSPDEVAAAVAAVRAENERLAGQVAAIRARLDDMDAQGSPFPDDLHSRYSDGYNAARDEIRAITDPPPPPTERGAHMSKENWPSAIGTVAFWAAVVAIVWILHS